MKLECVKEKLDDSAMGRFARQMLAMFAEMERERILDRTEDGRLKRIANGKMLTGNKPKYGYHWANAAVGEKGTSVIDEEEAKIVKRMFDYFVTVRSSCRGLTIWLNEQGIPTPSGKVEKWNGSTVYCILTDPFYCGEAYTRRRNGSSLKPKGEWIPMPEGTVPAIIDKATFQKAQELLTINRQESQRNNKYQPQELLRCGFVKCGYCKRNMSAHRHTYNGPRCQHVKTQYMCQYRYGHGPECPCPPSIAAEKAVKIAWDYVGELIKDFTIVEKAVALARKRTTGYAGVTSIKRSIKNAEENIDLLTAELNEKVDGKLRLQGRARENHLRNLQEAENHLEALQKDREDTQAGHIHVKRMLEELDRFIEWCFSGRESYEKATYEQKRTAIRNLGLVMYVYRKDDPDHGQYEIAISIPELSDIVLHSLQGWNTVLHCL